MLEKAETQVVKLEALPDDAWVQLRTWNLESPYTQIVTGIVDVDVLESFCASVRAALDEYSADTRRVAGRNDDAVRELIRASNHVLRICGRYRGQIEEPCAKLRDVVADFKTALRMSIAAAKKKTKSLAA